MIVSSCASDSAPCSTSALGSMRAVGRKRRAHRRHRRRLDKLRRMRLRALDGDRLHGVRLVEALAEGGAALGRFPGAVDHLGRRDRQLRSGLWPEGKRRLWRQAPPATRPREEAAAAGRERLGRDGSFSSISARSSASVAAWPAVSGDSRIAAHAVDDGQPRIDGRAVPRVDRAGDGRGKDARAFTSEVLGCRAFGSRPSIRQAGRPPAGGAAPSGCAGRPRPSSSARPTARRKRAGS